MERSTGSSTATSVLPALGTLLAALLLLAGCGPSDSRTAGDAPAAGALSHKDGVLSLDGDFVFVAAGNDGAAVTRLRVGPELSRGELEALASSDEPVRVYYRDGEEPVALRVEKLQQPKGAQRAVGLVAERPTETTLTLAVEGRAEPLRLTIRPENAEGFDVPHLVEHQQSDAPIAVFYETTNGTAYALAYEDA